MAQMASDGTLPALLTAEEAAGRACWEAWAAEHGVTARWDQLAAFTQAAWMRVAAAARAAH